MMETWSKHDLELLNYCLQLGMGSLDKFLNSIDRKRITEMFEQLNEHLDKLEEQD